MVIDVIAWIVLGTIAGLVAGYIWSGDEGLGVIGHIVLGIVGALVGGSIAILLGFGSGRQGADGLNLQSVVVAVIGAIVVLLVVDVMRRGSHSTTI